MVLIVAAAAVSGIFSLPSVDRLHGVSNDTLHWLRAAIVGQRHAPETSPVVVLAIDEETYRRPTFLHTPRVMWTPQIANVLDGLTEARAQVIGFDVIFPTSAEKYVRGYDRKFLLSLRRAAKDGKVVLGKVQHQIKPISPHPAQSFAVGHEANIRSVNVFEDDDGVIRRVPLFLEASTLDGGTRLEPSMALELASRALGVRPLRQGDGNVRLGRYTVPGSSEGSMLVNFDSGDDFIPTYSFADIDACITEGNTEFLRTNFAGKIVLLGRVLDVEDRKLTSRRLISKQTGTVVKDRCELPEIKDLVRTDVSFDTIPGVYVHAAAINNIVRGEALVQPAIWLSALITFGIALIVGTSVLKFSSTAAVLIALACILVWTVAATALFQNGVAFPFLDQIAGTGAAFVGLVGYKAAVSDRDRRYIRRVFSFYLPQQVIEQIVAQEELPTLGGEEKEVTILFSDIASFTTLSEGLGAREVASFLNDYLTEMSDIIEAHGGFIEKYVADEITGVFGAPVANPDHAVNAVEAALRCAETLKGLPGAFGLPPDRVITARTGINSGEMLVGNIGSHRRFNYAAMGDAANLGSRIEGANRFYGTGILVGERTRELCGDRFEFRAVDVVRVVGRASPVTLYEPLARSGELSSEVAQMAERFTAAMDLYRARKFHEAAVAFEAGSATDPVCRVFAGRARQFAASPPGDDWDGVTDLTSK